MCNHCTDCPAQQDTETSMMAVEVGCLPSYWDMKKWYLETGKVWACHERPVIPCIGFIKFAKELDNLIVKVTEKGLITEDTTLEEIYA